MAAYDSYKDSGVKWLGKVPRHWEILPGKAVFSENKVKNDNNTEKFVLSLSYGRIIPKKDLTEGLVPENYSAYQIVEPGYIIIRCTDLQNDKVSLRTGFVKNHGIISGAYLGLKTKSCFLSQYMHLLLHVWDITKELYRYGSGLRQSLSWNDIKYLNIPIPPREEQEAIVSYLDNVTAKIDEAIEAQQKMIDALNERKQIIITRAVTRNMDKWYKIPLRFVFEMRNGYTPSKADPSFWENGTIPWYRMEDIRKSGRFLNESIQTISPKAVKSKGTFKAGSYIMAICTASIGEHAMLIADSLANQQFMNFKVHKSLINELSPKFIFYYFYVIGKFCRDNANSTCFQYVDMAALKRYPIPVPSIAEQQDIVTYIEQATSAIDSSLSATEHRLNLLQERKQIIINEVVTGKKKVI